MNRIGDILQQGLDAAEKRKAENLKGARKKRVEELLFDRLLGLCAPRATHTKGGISVPLTTSNNTENGDERSTK